MIEKSVLHRLSGLRNKFEKSSEIFRKVIGNLRKYFGKWQEIFGKSSKTPSLVCLYNKKNITRQVEDMNFMFPWQEYLKSEHRYCSCHATIKFISSRYRVISSIYLCYGKLLFPEGDRNLFSTDLTFVSSQYTNSACKSVVILSCQSIAAGKSWKLLPLTLKARYTVANKL